MRSRQTRWATGVGLALAGVLTGCGSSSNGNGEQSKDATTILNDSVQALRGAGTVHLNGDITSDGSHIQLDLDVASKDTVAGTFTIDGVPVRLTTANGTSYLAGRKLWDKVDPSGKAANLFGERCVLVPPTFPGAASILSGINQISDLGALADGLSKPKGTLSKGSNTSVNGMGTIVLKDSVSSLYVATDGKPYPLRIEMTGSDSGHIDLTFNRPASISPPPDCLDVSKLSSP